MNYKKWIAAALAIFAPLNGFSQTITFTRANNGTNSISIPLGESWQIFSWYAPEGNYNDVYFSYFIGGDTNSGAVVNSIYLGGTSYQFFSVDNPASGGSAYYPIGFIISGPASFRASSYGNNTNKAYSLSLRKINSGNTNSTISATSVVIPSSATGDVDVKMEQSADNVTWTECLPGTYNSSTVKRFFRLRAVEK